MIILSEDYYALETQHTTYAFRVLPSGHIEHLWYGEKIDCREGAVLLGEPRSMGGNMVAYSAKHPKLGLENLCLEYSSLGKGDIRDPMIELRFADGSTTCDFLFQSAKVRPYTPLVELPSAAMMESVPGEELVVHLRDAVRDVWLELVYVPFPTSDIIVRSARVINRQREPLLLHRLLSAQLDFRDGAYDFISFHGAWVREMERQVVSCGPCRIVNEGRTGTSSSRANPFVMLAARDCGEGAGRCWGMNLIYSGEHYESAQQNSFGKVRVLSGIHPEGFCWRLAPGEAFQAPQAVLGFSAVGYSGLSKGLHHFVRHHVVRGPWQFRERPILLNSWESAYYKYDEESLLHLAEHARAVGIELFVLDDGWFMGRNSDASSLGDWHSDKGKLPNGLSGFAKKLGQLGLDFGLWVEPEMVSMESACYRKHPEWVVSSPNRPHAEGRNQRILDLTKTEVREYILRHMRRLFRIPGLTYVKWDMNRIFSDRYSASLPPEGQGEFLHRYVLGLYGILERLTREFPHILFESCAAGGNRSDWGMLCYMQQLWASDNTDALCRAAIQHQYSYAYPPSVIGAHVSACPNHQTGRTTSLRTRFHVACFGLLGYECDLRGLSEGELKEIRWQITYYKQRRTLFQFGDFIRLAHDESATQWCVAAPGGASLIVLDFPALTLPNMLSRHLRLAGFVDDGCYRVRETYFEEAQVLGTASGSLLNHAGLSVPLCLGRGGGLPWPDFFTRMLEFDRESTSKERQKYGTEAGNIT